MALHFSWAEEDTVQELPEDWPYNESPWQILGVGPDATADEVRKAQRELSRTLHPDHEEGDTNRQKAVNRAAEEMLRMRQAA
jgi:curved DNA-binding protein CbpA